jgi:alpha-D-xyloside xylohydrolase
MPDPDRPRTFLDGPRPVRLAWAVEGVHARDHSLVLRCRTERFEPAFESLTGVTAEFPRERASPPGVAELRIDPWNDDVVRVRFAPRPVVAGAPTPLVTGAPGPPSRWEVVDTPGGLRLTTGSLRVEVDRDPLRLVVHGPDGDPVLVTRPPDLPALRAQDRMWDRAAQRWLYLTRHAYPLGTTDDGRASCAFASLELRPGERIYGFGEDFGRVEKTGTRHDLWVQEAFTNASPLSYKPVPFLWSTRGYGLFVNTSHAARAHVGDLDPTALSVVVEQADELDLFLIHGPEPARILARWAELTGPPAVPPRWSFGLWLSRCSYRTQDEVESVAREARERRFAADVINIDTAWFEQDWRCDWRFGSRFPDPAGMVERLAQLGFRVTLWQWPYVGVDSPAFPELRDGDLLVRRPSGHAAILPGGNAPDVGVIDYSDPRAVAWIGERLRPLFGLGVAGIKADFGEGAPGDGVYAGIDGAAAHNAYPLLYGRALWEAAERARGPGESVLWARSAWAGSQRYPVHWSGDGLARFEDLACVLRAALSMGLSGFPFYSHDIGGFLGVPTPELYVRWAQLGLFSSHARVHGMGPREPWAFGARAEAIVRRYVELRYRLMPYLWTEAVECGRTGLPMVRALVLDDPGDPTVRAIDDQYLLGRDLLVAPILDERDRRDVYLPRGRWVDLATGEGRDGRRWIEVEAPLDVLPLFVRAGAILPLAPPMLHTDERPLDPLTLQIREPAAEGSALIRDPGGDIDVRYALEGDRLEVRVVGAPGAVEVSVPGRVTDRVTEGREGAARVIALRLS